MYCKSHEIGGVGVDSRHAVSPLEGGIHIILQMVLSCHPRQILEVNIRPRNRREGRVSDVMKDNRARCMINGGLN